ncbi:NF038215 family lipoprotein [Acinetobacter sp. ANC 4648]|uniref:NF038215 family lipoprotein n=1 Tax=Acinetobacter sp. ANC 4648 TaxID=1977875 RepID=UPI000A330E04|nr:NF038215 family lipoprotein [Acinetobacter sp. ANC 4648]OTG83855.1 hypothetical protein B9T27_04990 [Acinetobacter sp. ANC 4648]
MKILSLCSYIVIAMAIMGCEKSPISQTKTEVRSIQIAGMPVYDKDYQLTSRENNSEIQP